MWWCQQCRQWDQRPPGRVPLFFLSSSLSNSCFCLGTSVSVCCLWMSFKTAIFYLFSFSLPSSVLLSSFLLFIFKIHIRPGKMKFKVTAEVEPTSPKTTLILGIKMATPKEKNKITLVSIKFCCHETSLLIVDSDSSWIDFIN